jgi:hypothetical protein
MLRSLLAVGLSGSLAGCNALFGTGSAGRTEATTTDVTPPPTADRRTAAGSSRPYRVAGAPTLDRPRGVWLRNLASTARFVTVVVDAGDAGGDELLVESVSVPARGTVSFADLIGSAGRYRVLVETADGARERYDWDLRPAFDDLWVDLTPSVTFHRPVVCLPDSPFAVDDTERTVAYEVPADVGIRGALGRTPALAIDNDAARRRRVRVEVHNRGERRLSATYDLPPDVRALVPVLPASGRYDVALRTDDGEATYDWQPSVRTTLYASVAEGPGFRCGYADHDLQVRNETDTARRLRVRVLTGDETLFERSFDLDRGAVETVPSAVDPAGPFRFEIATDDGTVERYDWNRCAPSGPLTIALSDRGVYVSVRPTRELA